ncbi:prolipoprotein diacylglyceryl transferase [Patescibacteria group bacterium]|nr:prolipoprotein diacylglyceryl transferase [Patescibacteria group bacterium]
MFVHDISPVLVEIGSISLRWYGVLFALGIVINYLILMWVFKREGEKIETLDSLVLYLFFGLVIGARLGHVFFYDWGYYSQHFSEILMIWRGGLASHGAAIGLLISYLLWIWRHKVNFTKYPDLLVIAMPITAGFVRLGNFFNSEIIGLPTNGNWGVVFKRLGEDFPRHPSQIYEAGLSFVIFIILFVLYLKFYKKLPKLFILFTYILLYFSTRFLVEFWKERQTVSADFPLTMGQILSILPILLAVGYFVILFVRTRRDIRSLN